VNKKKSGTLLRPALIFSTLFTQSVKEFHFEVNYFFSSALGASAGLGASVAGLGASAAGLGASVAGLGASAAGLAASSAGLAASAAGLAASAAGSAAGAGVAGGVTGLDSGAQPRANNPSSNATEQRRDNFFIVLFY
jgi:hypothetical protein